MKIGRIIIGIILGSLIIMGIDTILIEPNLIDVNIVNIEDTGNNVKIIFISDFQRRNADPSFVQNVVTIINEQNPDLVLLGGDYVDKTADELPSIEPLKMIDAEYGVYGVLGNHDYDVYWLNRDGVDTELASKIKGFLEQDNTIKIIQNESLQIEGMEVVFLDSYWAGLRDDTLLDSVKERYRIVLTHNQNQLEINKDMADLYLFGHTHCGQIRLPLVGSVPKTIGFEGEYDYRHYIVDNAHVYTTCGLTPAPRFLNMPEITVINLS